jgi:hypothetical protein
MGLFDDKEQVRMVYKFDKNDPAFEMFYVGLMCFESGDTSRAEREFMTLLSDNMCHNTIPIYRYLIPSMIKNGRNLEDVKSYLRKWESDACIAENYNEQMFAQRMIKSIESSINNVVDHDKI